MTRYVIIGAGVAGVSAMETLREHDPEAEIVLVTEDPHGFYTRPGLAYYLSEEIPKSRLPLYRKQDWKALKVHYIHDSVMQINPKFHRIMMKKKGHLAYDKLLLATGSRAMPLTVPGAEAKGVVTLDTYEDACQILSQARRARTAVVAGGGVTALEMAEGLAARGVKVHYFIRGERYWAKVLDEAESCLIEDHLSQMGVSVHHHTQIREIQQRHGRVKAVVTNGSESIPCDIVAMGIGVKPCTELAQAAGLQTDRGIRVNEYLQTSDPDIYAAGDAAEVIDPQTGASSMEALWLPARKMGWAAALNMVGKGQAYVRTPAVNAVRLAGVMVTIVGAVGSGIDEDLVSTARGSSETWLQLPNTIAMSSGNKLNHLRVMVGERTLLGAVLLGEQKLSQPLQELVTHQVDIGPIRPRLLDPAEPLGHILMDYWTSLLESHS